MFMGLLPILLLFWQKDKSKRRASFGKGPCESLCAGCGQWPPGLDVTIALIGNDKVSRAGVGRVFI
jgi:hypothetical protein